MPLSHGGCGGGFRGWAWHHARGLTVYDRQGQPVLTDPDSRQGVLFPNLAKGTGQ